LGSPFFYFSSDQLVDADVLPSVDRQAKTGEWAWRTIRPRFFDGFHRCAAAIADSGNDMILEHVIEFRSWYVDLVTLLRHHAVFFVGVHCEIGELERRERVRGDRRVGEGRSHLEDGVHTWGRYDVEVDTFRFSEEAARGRVVEAFRRHEPERSAFRAAWLDLQRGGASSP
jgi:chloramphenicol 3-O phosphotransferase